MGGKYRGWVWKTKHNNNDQYTYLKTKTGFRMWSETNQILLFGENSFACGEELFTIKDTLELEGN